MEPSRHSGGQPSLADASGCDESRSQTPVWERTTPEAIDSSPDQRTSRLPLREIDEFDEELVGDSSDMVIVMRERLRTK